MGVSSVPDTSSDIRVSSIWIQGRTQAKDQQKLYCDRKKKKSTFRAVEDGLSYNEEVADGEKSCWAPWPPRCRRLVRISRSIPDWCRRIHQKRIHTTQTEDRRPALSFVRDHNLYAAHSPQWWLVVASNQAVQRFTFLPPGPLTTQAMGPSPCCSLSPSPGPWITLHTYISEHCDNAALSKFTKIIGHCLEQLWQQQVLFPCVNNFSNLKQCNWSQTICCPSGETWLVGKVGNPGNHFLRHTVGVQPELPPPTLTYTKTQAHTFTRSIQLLCQVFSAVCLLK